MSSLGAAKRRDSSTMFLQKAREGVVPVTSLNRIAPRLNKSLRRVTLCYIWE